MGAQREGFKCRDREIRFILQHAPSEFRDLNDTKRFNELV